MEKRTKNWPELVGKWLGKDTVSAAKTLIGMRLRVGEAEIRITETEAYTEDDPASHAVTRKPSAGEIMRTAGAIYVYQIYGVHFCLNITTDRNQAGAVLIRAGEPLAGLESMRRRRGQVKLELLTVGPGRLCQALGVDKSFSGEPVGERIELLPGSAPERIGVSPRIGITNGRDLPYRFFDAASRFVSKTPRKQ